MRLISIFSFSHNIFYPIEDKLCFLSHIQTFPKRQILDASKLKEFADNNFKFDENGRKFSKSIENIVRKGEIARYEQFLPFPQCFQKTYTEDT